MSKYTYAYDKTGKLVHISSAQCGKEYTCRCCGDVLIPKKGRVKVHHFAHKAGYSCDSWYENKGEWHRKMQGLFPQEYQEVPMSVDGEKHIADVLITKPSGQKLVIEFQHSSMNQEEFIERTLFWKSNNTDLIWVFDVQNKDIREIPNSKRSAYKWIRPISTFGKRPINSVPIILFMQPQIDTKSSQVTNIYGETTKIEGQKVSEPFFFQIKESKLKYQGKVFDHYKGIVGDVIGNQEDFMDYLKERMNSDISEPFVEYDKSHCFRFSTKEDYSKMKAVFEATLNEKELMLWRIMTSRMFHWGDRLCFYIEEADSIKITEYGYDNSEKILLIDRLKKIVGKENYKME